jgi:hypothetical protein
MESTIKSGNSARYAVGNLVRKSGEKNACLSRDIYVLLFAICVLATRIFPKLVQTGMLVLFKVIFPDPDFNN